MAMLCVVAAYADTFNYSFRSERLSEALVQVAVQHPELQINFICNELDNYRTTATVCTKDPYDALRQIIGLNPVSIIKKGNCYYIEALQHGRFNYTGSVVGSDNDPVIGASVVLLTPRDSMVVTYGITDSEGRFSIPCDRKKVLVKLSCLGYKTTYNKPSAFAMGTIVMQLSPIRLSSLSVEADNTILSSDKNIYIPSTSQKNASQDVGDLLRRMAVPQLVINPADNSVRDVFGNIVPVYINYHEAQPDELKGMKMTDVRKIEYLESPTDPRFKGELRVVNVIVREYEYGGYTKASESLKVLNGFFNNIDIFSRFTYKKMTYDVFAGSDNQNYHHAGSDISAVYRLEDNGSAKDVTRKEIFNESHTRTNEYPLTFRASYYSSHFTARNTLSFTHWSSPSQFSCGELSINSHPERNYVYSRNTPALHNTVSYNGNLWAALGKNASLDIAPVFRHTHRNNTSAYESSLLDAAIRNFITEDSYNWSIQASGRISVGSKSQLSLFMAGGQNINDLIYRGSNNVEDHYSNSFAVSELRYRYQTRKLSVSSFLGLGFEHNSMNGNNLDDFFPRMGVNARLSLSNRSQVSAYISYQSTTPDISMKANDIIQSNEYMFLTANPNLRNWRNLNSNLSYNRICCNSLSLAAFAGYEQDFNRVATIYRPYGNGTALLRDFVNNGSFKHCYLGISANYKLFNNSLQLYANLTQNAYEITGDYSDSYYPFRIQLQAVYYWKAFNILASWGNPRRTLTENSNNIIQGRNFHMFSIGWGNGTWMLNLSANNIFNKGWLHEVWEKRTPLYDECQRIYSPSVHPAINMAVTYTIGYGKKVRQGDEVGGQGSAPSAIVR